jgi:hypothetical protein
VLAIDEHGPQRRLDVAVPQLGAVDPPVNRPPQQLAEDPPAGQIEADDQVRAGQQQRPHRGTLPLGDPALRGGEGRHVRRELRTGHPARPVPQGVQLVVRDVEPLGERRGDRALPRPRTPGDEHPARAVRQWVGRAQRLHDPMMAAPSLTARVNVRP